MGTVSLPGVDYPGKTIEPDEEGHLLQASEYADVSAYVAPLFNRVMRRMIARCCCDLGYPAIGVIIAAVLLRGITRCCSSS